MFLIYIPLWIIGVWLIHSVLSKIANAVGWRSARVAYFILGISLFWPVAPELAVPLMVIFGIWQGAKWLAAEEERQAAETPPGVAR